MSTEKKNDNGVLTLEKSKYIKKFYIEKKRMFGFVSKKLLILTEYGIHIQDFPNKELNDYFPFQNIVKIIPSKENLSEIVVTVAKKKFIETYSTGLNDPTFLISCYLKAVDLFQEKQQFSLGDEHKSAFSAGSNNSNNSNDTILMDTSYWLNNVDNEKMRSVQFIAYRSFLRIQIHEDHQNNENQDCGNDNGHDEAFNHEEQDDLLADYLDIDYISISEIIVEHFGFRIILEKSGGCVTIQMLNNERKNVLVDKIISNSKVYLKHQIQYAVSDNHQNFFIGKLQSEESCDSFFKLYKAFGVTQFGEIYPMTLAMNDLYLYEIVNDKINDKLSLRHINQLVLKQTFQPILILSFIDDYKTCYQIKNEDIECFITQLIQIVELSKKSGVSLDENDSQARTGCYINSDFSGFVRSRLIQTKLIDNELKINGMNRIDSVKELEKNLLTKINSTVNLQNQGSLLDEFQLNCPFNNDISPDQILIKIAQMVNEQTRMFYSESVKNVFGLINKDQTENCQNIFSKYNVLKNRVFGDQGAEFGLGEKDDGILKLKYFWNKKYIKRVCAVDYIDEEISSMHLTAHDIHGNIVILEKLLNFLSSCMTNKNFFKEFAIQINIADQKISEIYMNFFNSIYTLFKQDLFRLINFQAGNLFVLLVKFPGNNFERKAESLNKNLVIGNKCHFRFLNEIWLYMANMCLGSSQQEMEKLILMNNFRICITLNIIEAFIFDRKDTTMPEDLNLTLKWLNNELGFQILSQQSRSDSLYIIYKSSLILNAIMQSQGVKEKIKEYQTQVLNHSTLLLKHIELSMSPVSKRQKQLSVVFLYHCLIDNITSCSLMTRLIPKPLFRHVDSSSNDISKWTLIQWEELFEMLNFDFSNATEQWNSECRSELRDKVREAQNEFYNKWVPLSNEALSKVIAEIDRQHIIGKLPKDISNSVMQLRWNFEEYDLTYSVLLKKLPVWKYYQEELYINENKPFLKVEIQNPKKQWEELTVRLISSDQIYEKIKILQTMILLYQKYFERIKELTFISYLVKLLSTSAYPEFKYLVLQLIYTCLIVPNVVLVNQNLRKFHEAGGLYIIRTYMLSCITLDDNTILRNIDIKENPSQILDDECTLLFKKNKYSFSSNSPYRRNTIEFQINDENTKPVYNYSYASLGEAKSMMDLMNNQLVLTLLVMKVCLSKTRSPGEDLMLFPHPLTRKIILEDETIILLQLLLMSKNEAVLLATHEFLSLGYLDKFSYKRLLQETNLLELVFLRLQGSFARLAITNIREVFFKIENDANPEEKLAFSGLLSMSFITEDKVSPILNQLFSPFGLQPKFLIHKLIDKGFTEFIGIYFCDEYFTPDLLWNSKMKEELNTTLEKYFFDDIQKVKSVLIEMHKDNTSNQDLYWDKLRIHPKPVIQISYNEIQRTIKCGPIFLKMWIKPEFDDFRLPDEIVPKFIVELYELLKSNVINFIDSDKLLNLSEVRNLHIILKSHSKVLKLYSISDYDCYEALDKVLEFWMEMLELTKTHDKCDSILLNRWENNIILVFEIIIVSIKNADQNNVRQFCLLKRLKENILRVATIVLSNYYECEERKISWNELKIQHNLVLQFSQLKAANIEWFDLFDIEKAEKVNLISNSGISSNSGKGERLTQSQYEKKERMKYMDIEQILCFILGIYTDYFYELEKTGFSRYYEENRIFSVDEISKDYLGVLSNFLKSNIGNSVLKPEAKDLESFKLIDDQTKEANNVENIQKTHQPEQAHVIDPTLTNAFKLMTSSQPSGVLSTVIEERFCDTIMQILQLLMDLSSRPQNLWKSIKSGLVFRVYEIGGFGISKAILYGTADLTNQEQQQSISSFVCPPSYTIHSNCHDKLAAIAKTSLKCFRNYVVILFEQVLADDYDLFVKYLPSIKQEHLNSLCETGKTIVIEDPNKVNVNLFIMINLFGSNFLERLVSTFYDYERIDNIYDNLINGIIEINFIMNKGIMKRIRKLLGVQFKAIYDTKGKDYNQQVLSTGSCEMADEPVIRSVYLSSYLLNPTKIDRHDQFLQELSEFYSNISFDDYKKINILLDFMSQFTDVHPNCVLPYNLEGYLIELHKDQQQGPQYKIKILDLFIRRFTKDSSEFFKSFMEGRFMTLVFDVIMNLRDCKKENDELSIRWLILIYKIILDKQKSAKAVIDSGAIMALLLTLFNNEINQEFRLKILEILILIKRSRSKNLDPMYAQLEEQSLENLDGMQNNERTTGEDFQDRFCKSDDATVKAHEKKNLLAFLGNLEIDKITPNLCFNHGFRNKLMDNLLLQAMEGKLFANKNVNDNHTYDDLQNLGNTRKKVQIVKTFAYTWDFQSSMSFIQDEIIVHNIGLKLWLSHSDKVTKDFNFIEFLAVLQVFTQKEQQQDNTKSDIEKLNRIGLCMSVIVNVMEMYLLDKNNCYLVEEDLLQNALKVIYHSMSDLIDFLSEAKVNSNFEMILDCEESELYFLKLENCLLAAQTLCLVTKINDYIKSNLFHPKFNESIEFLVSRYVKFTNTKELGKFF